MLLVMPREHRPAFGSPLRKGSRRALIKVLLPSPHSPTTRKILGLPGLPGSEKRSTPSSQTSQGRKRTSRGSARLDVCPTQEPLHHARKLEAQAQAPLQPSRFAPGPRNAGGLECQSTHSQVTAPCSIGHGAMKSVLFSTALVLATLVSCHVIAL